MKEPSKPVTDTAPMRSSGEAAEHRRVLVVDDNPDIHDLIRKMLGSTAGSPSTDDGLREIEEELFGDQPKEDSPARPAYRFEVESAFQGEDAVRMVEERPPYLLAFVDMRMPPGINGLETIQRLWRIAPYLYTVICSAYSDHSWEDIQHELGDSPNLLILRKPFESVEVRQIAATIGCMYDALSRVRAAVGMLENHLVSQADAIQRLEVGIDALLSDDDAVLFADADHRIVSAHGNVGRLLGSGQGDVVGRLLTDYFDWPAEGDARGGLATTMGPDSEIDVRLVPIEAQETKHWLCRVRGQSSPGGS